MTVDVRRLDGQNWELGFWTRAAPALVHTYVLDVGRHVEWESDLTRAVLRSGPAGQPGTLWAKTYGAVPAGLRRLVSKPYEVQCRIEISDPPYRLDWKQWRHQGTSGAHGFHRYELRLAVQDGWTRVTLVRRPDVADGTSIDAAAAVSRWLGEAVDQLPPELQQQMMAAMGGGANPLVGSESPEDLAGVTLERVPARGPGGPSLERLQAILDSWA